MVKIGLTIPILSELFVCFFFEENKISEREISYKHECINEYTDKLAAMFESHKRNSKEWCLEDFSAWDLWHTISHTTIKKQFYISLSLAENVSHP